MTSANNIILVLGGRGKTGRRVADRLTARGLPVRIGSRSGTPPFAWENRETWAPVLQGVKSVYITYQPDLAAPAAQDDIRAFTEMAVAANVERLVLLSGRGEDEAQRCEEIVQQSGAAWTIVRASWFHQNFSEDYLLEPVINGEVVLPVGGVLEPFIDADDIADVAVAALTDDKHAGQVYEVTGPRLMTFAQAVAEIASATGRDIRFVEAPSAAYFDALRAAGLPEGQVSLIEYLFTTVLDGRNESLADGVQRALGRPARDFADYARETAASGVWSAQNAVAAP